MVHCVHVLPKVDSLGYIFVTYCVSKYVSAPFRSRIGNLKRHIASGGECSLCSYRPSFNHFDVVGF